MTRILLIFLSVALITISLPFTAKVSANNYSSQEIQHFDGTIVIPVGSQSNQLRHSQALPEYGQTMDDVKKLLGTASQTDTIGEPAITRWYYPDQRLTVYFEGERVLRSVIHNTP